MKILHISVFAIILISFQQPIKAQIVKAYLAGGCNLSQVDGDMAFGYKKAGVNAGIGVRINILPFMSASIETNFNQKGVQQKATQPDSIRTGAYHLNINYAEIPILFQFYDKSELFKLGVGFSYARMVNAARENDHRIDNSNYIIYNKNSDFTSYKDFIPINESNKNFEFNEKVVQPWNEKYGNLNSNDFSIIGSIEARIWERIKLEFRISYSLRKLRTADFYRAFGVTYDESGKNFEYYDDGAYKACFQRKEYNNTVSFRAIYVINEKQAEKNKNDIKSKKYGVR